MRLTQWLEEFQDDLRSGIHQLTHSPAFALVAGITLALGIGANAAVFAVVKSVLVDALPYADADRLVRVYGRMRDGLLVPLRRATRVDPAMALRAQ